MSEVSLSKIRHELMTTLSRIEGKIDALIHLHGVVPAIEGRRATTDAQKIFGKLTPKQNCAAQALAAGVSEPELALRMNVSRNTVKQHVACVLVRLGTRDRREAGSRLRGLLATISDVEYHRITGGIPKNWITHRQSPDPIAHLLAPARQRPAYSPHVS